MKKLIALGLILVAGLASYQEGLNSSVTQYQSLPPIEDNLHEPKVQYSTTFKADGKPQLNHNSGW